MANEEELMMDKGMVETTLIVEISKAVMRRLGNYVVKMLSKYLPGYVRSWRGDKLAGSTQQSKLHLHG